MNITVRNIPEDVINKIRTLSQMERRSLNNEILLVLERGVQKEVEHRLQSNRNISKSTQINIWERLANKWQDDRSTNEIIDDIYQSRTFGREIEL